MKMFAIISQRYQLIVVLLVFAFTAGCGVFGSNTIVNDNVARESLEAFLQAWSDGETPDDLQPKIIGKDLAWSDGHKLISYEILEEKPMGTSMHISAKLTLENLKGAKKTPIANYIVGTSPSITVFRDED